jgi:flagellar hook-length control protein FliK
MENILINISKNEFSPEIKSSETSRKTRTLQAGEENSFQKVMQNIRKEDEAKERQKFIEKIDEKIQSIEEKLNKIISESPAEFPEAAFNLKLFLKELKEILNYVKEHFNSLENGNLTDLNNILLTFDKFLSFVLSLVEKKDFSGLTKIISGNENLSLENFKKEINRVLSSENNEKVKDLSKTPVKEMQFSKVEVIKKNSSKSEVAGEVKKNSNFFIEKENKNTQALEKDNVKVTFKKEIDFIKDFSANSDTKKIDTTANVAVKNYHLSSSVFSKVDLAKLFSEISGRAFVVLKEGKSELRMQLFPPELGRMNMKFVLEDGQLTGKIVVSTKEAFMLFDQNKDNLANALSQAGVELGKIDVMLGDFESGNNNGFESDEKTSFYFGNTGNSLELETVEREYEEKLLHSLYDGLINYLV